MLLDLVVLTSTSQLLSDLIHTQFIPLFSLTEIQNKISKEIT